ncbi:protein CTLA-2-beta-like [Bradysia coprophila]|uniref:protein CTLA-2-beta-like n=1 Tax=Bradysia coprophila TaxID=38358 RepID=UPI00187D8C3F|nr:protein CTLA-2-beta-like [Bradysia coprophila]
MFVLIIFVCFSLIISSNSESNGVDLKNFTRDTNVTDLWELYKTNYKKEYDSDEETAKRFEIFAANVKKIIDHNEEYEKGQSTYKMGLNKFADYTPEELQELRHFSLMG